MKTVFRIAKLELSTLFYSPVAWLVLVIFVFQSGLGFMDALSFWQKIFKAGWGGTGFTLHIFSSPRSLFTAVQSNLYLYIPLLTMGLISRELSSGSIKLLYSSPIKISSIVLGKFLSMMLYSLILMLVLMMFVLTGSYSLASMDWGLVMSGIFGLYLLACAYSAVGLFMSSLTSYQVVAAISTLVLFAGLNYVGGLAQNVPILKDIAYFLSISGRSDQMISGLISSKDVIYFTLIIILFIGLTTMRLLGARESISAAVKSVRYAVFILVILTAGYLSSRPIFIVYADLTATKSKTLTANTQNILKKLTRPLKVTTYANLFDNYFSNFIPTEFNANKARFEPYTRFLPSMQFDYVYYYDSTNNHVFEENPGMSELDLVKKVSEPYDMTDKEFLTPGEIRKKIDLRPEENRSVRLYEYEGKKGFTRMFIDNEQHPGEQEITAVLKSFLVPQPAIGFVSDKGERNIDKEGDREFKNATRRLDFRHALINQGFTVSTVFLAEDEIPKGISCLVIADPKSPYNDKELAKIRTYLSGGGNLLIMGDPGHQDNINPVIKPLGVELMKGVLIQESKDNAPDFILTKFSTTAGKYSTDWRDTNTVISMPGAVGLTFEAGGAFRIDPIVVTNKINTWNRSDKVDPDSLNVTYNAAKGDSRSTIPVGAALTRKIAGVEQRVMIFGDADFMSNNELLRNNMPTRNFSLVSNIFRWFSNGAFPIDVSRPALPDNRITIGSSGIRVMKIVFLGIIPTLLIALGATILIIRKRN